MNKTLISVNPDNSTLIFVALTLFYSLYIYLE